MKLVLGNMFRWGEMVFLVEIDLIGVVGSRKSNIKKKLNKDDENDNKSYNDSTWH